MLTSFDAFAGPERRWIERMRAHTITTYEGLVVRGGRAFEFEEEARRAVLEQLRSLGYVE